MDARRRILLLWVLSVTAAVCPAAGQGPVRPASQPDTIVAALLARSRFLGDVHFQVPLEFYRQYLAERDRPIVPIPYIAESVECHVTVAADRSAAVEFELHLRVFDPAGAANIGVLDSRLDWQDITLNDKSVRFAQPGPCDELYRWTPREPGAVVIKAKAKLPSVPTVGGEIGLATSRAVRTLIRFDSPGVWAIRLKAARGGKQAQGEVESDQPWLVGSTEPAAGGVVGAAGTHGQLCVSPRESLRIEIVPPQAKMVHPTRYELRGETAWNFDDAICQVAAALRVTVAGGPANRFELLLPEGAERVRITGPEVREAQIAGGKATVYLRGQILGSTDVKVAFERPLGRQAAAGTGEQSFDQLAVVDGHWVDGTLVITNTAGGSEILPATATGLERIELARIPTAAAAILRGAPALAYRITGRTFDAKVELLSLGQFALRQSIADLAHYEFFLDRDGAVAGRVKYEIRNRNQQFLQLDLPPDAQVLLAHVNEKSVPLTPVAGTPGRWRLQLERSQASVMGLVSFPAEIVYLCRVAPLDKGRAGPTEISLPLPQIDLPIAYGWCEAFLPAGMQIKEWSGPMRRVSDFSSQTAKASLDYGSGELAAGYLARNRPTAPTERPRPIEPTRRSGAGFFRDSWLDATNTILPTKPAASSAQPPSPTRPSVSVAGVASLVPPAVAPAGGPQPLPTTRVVPSAGPTVNLDNAAPSISSLNLGGKTGGFTIAQGASSGVLKLNLSNDPATANVVDGSHALGAPVQLAKPSGGQFQDSSALLARNYYRAGKDYYEKGDYEQAAQNFEQVGKLAPGSVEAENATRLLANQSVLAGKFDAKSAEQQAAAADVQREVKEQQAGTAKTQSKLIQKAEQAIQSGKTTEARVALEAAQSLGLTQGNAKLGMQWTYPVPNSPGPAGRRDDSSSGTFTFNGGTLAAASQPATVNVESVVQRLRSQEAAEVRRQMEHFKAAKDIDAAFARAKQLRDIEGNTPEIQKELQQLAVESVQKKSLITGGQVSNRSDGPDRAEIQLRAARVEGVRTVVRVPDTGTLVLGGQRQSDELETESGTTVLRTPLALGLTRPQNDEMELRQSPWSRHKASVQDYLDRASVQVARPAEEEVKLTDDDFAAARKNIAQAENVLQNNESVADPGESGDLRRRIADLKLNIAKLEEKVYFERAASRISRATSEERDSVRGAAQERGDRINELFGHVDTARMKNDFPTMQKLIEQVLAIDPNNTLAAAALDNAKIQMTQMALRRTRDMDDWTARTLLNVRESMTPYDDPVYYPSADTWHELDKQRKGFKAGLPPESPANQRTRDALEKTIPEVRFPQVKFEDALLFLRDLQRVNINPNWAAMEAAGISKTTEINLQFRNVTFEVALRELLTKGAGKEGLLDYLVRDGVIKISTVEDLSPRNFTWRAQESPADPGFSGVLEKIIPEVRFPNIKFEDALIFMRDLQRVGMNPNWAAMEAAGIAKTTEINLQLRDVSFATALRELLVKAAGGENKLDFAVMDGVLKISTVEDLDRQVVASRNASYWGTAPAGRIHDDNTYTGGTTGGRTAGAGGGGGGKANSYVKVYDVRDLLHPLTDFQIPANNKTLSTNAPLNANVGGTPTGSGNIFAGGTAGEPDVEAAGRKKKAEAFLDMLKSAVAADTWGAAGGGNMKETDGLLVVKQSAQGHRQLEDLLKKLQEGSGPQVEMGGRLARQQANLWQENPIGDLPSDGIQDFSGSITGTAQIAKSGAGTLTLSDAERDPQLKKFIESNYDLKRGPGYIRETANGNDVTRQNVILREGVTQPTEPYNVLESEASRVTPSAPGGPAAGPYDQLFQWRNAERSKQDQSSDLADKLRRNLGQKVVVNSENLGVTADQAARLGIAFHKGAGDVNAAVVDEAQFRSLAELEAARPAGWYVDPNGTLQETIVGTEAQLANGGAMRVRFAGDRGNWLEISGNYVDLPHDRYLLIDNGDFLTAVRAGPMQHWTAKPADVSFYQVPQTIELPRVGQVVRSEKTLVAPSDRLTLRVTFTWKGDNP